MRAGEPAGSAIARSVNLAQHVEQLGYKRYWLAEHHSIPGLACSATPSLTRAVRPSSRDVISHIFTFTTVLEVQTKFDHHQHVSRYRCSRHARVPLLNFSLPSGPDVYYWED
jgi:hypothetical protein